MAEGTQVIVVDGLQAQVFKAFHLLPVVHYVAQAVELPCLLQLVLRATYGTCHTRAEAALAVNRYLHAASKMR